MRKKRILITGGCGFVGSHIGLILLENNFEITIVDSNINSSSKVIDNIIRISNNKNECSKDNISFIKGDLRDINFVNDLFTNSAKEGKSFDCVIHLSGLKSVSDSIHMPIKYWESNVSCTINLLKVMEKFNSYNLIFSSSAGIYDANKNTPLKETDQLNPISPYGKTKLAIENILEDLYVSNKDRWNILCLRYFNPIGAHPSGLIGEYPISNSNNIFPLILKTASSKIKMLRIFGNDWPTPDNTCVRDYIHVMDLAEGHVKGLYWLINKKSEFLKLNLGSGYGTSILELINLFEKVNKVKIPYKFAIRREGDVATLIADISMANKILGWKPKRDLSQMCIDSWRWHLLNPNGYIN